MGARAVAKAGLGRRVVRRFREAGAVSPRAAVAFEEVGLRKGLGEWLLVWRGVLRKAGEGRYWLDESAAQKFASRGRR